MNWNSQADRYSRVVNDTLCYSDLFRCYGRQPRIQSGYVLHGQRQPETADGTFDGVFGLGEGWANLGDAGGVTSESACFTPLSLVEFHKRMS